jgi:hypothetical protein
MALWIVTTSNEIYMVRSSGAADLVDGKES